MANKNKVEIEYMMKCPECGGRLITDYDRGEKVCESCGLVAEDNIIDEGPEYRVFDDGDTSQIHYGDPMTVGLHDKGLSTEIGYQNRDAYGHALPARNRSQIYRLRKWHKRVRVSNALERNFAQALSVINTYSMTLGIPEAMKNEAIIIYKKASAKNLIRGRCIKSVCGACIYASARKQGFPRTLDEISKATEISKKEIGRTYRMIAYRLKLNNGPVDPRLYVKRFCSKTGLSMNVCADAISIIDDICTEGHDSGRGPTGLAAAAIYLAALIRGEETTQQKVATAAGVTEVTIRNRVHEICRMYNIDMNELRKRGGVKDDNHINYRE